MYNWKIKKESSAVPKYFGALNNVFTYNRLTVTARLLYNFKYFARRSQNDLAFYTDLFNNRATGSIDLFRTSLIGAEYANRWRQPGDEAHTNVPSLTYPGSDVKDLAYQFADINVFKADHIRLQEVNLSYAVSTPKNWLIKNLSVNVNMPLNVIIWRANKLGIDPQVNDMPIPRRYGFGFRAGF